MSTLNYTTTIAAARTISEITTALVKHGASTITTSHGDGRPTGMSFTLPTPHGDRAFAMPVDVDAVLTLLTRQKRSNSRIRASRDQAERVAWRVLKDWIVAQLAIIEAQMASLDQVMLPYLRVDDSHTLYEAYKANEQRALTAGGQS